MLENIDSVPGANKVDNSNRSRANIIKTCRGDLELGSDLFQKMKLVQQNVLTGADCFGKILPCHGADEGKATSDNRDA